MLLCGRMQSKWTCGVDEAVTARGSRLAAEADGESGRNLLCISHLMHPLRAMGPRANYLDTLLDDTFLNIPYIFLFMNDIIYCFQIWQYHLACAFFSIYVDNII